MSIRRECEYCHNPIVFPEVRFCRRCRKTVNRLKFLQSIADAKDKFNMKSISKESTPGGDKIDKDTSYFRGKK